MPVKLKKTEGILATAAKAQDLQTAFVTASKAAKILGCPALKKVDDKTWGPKMAGKKAEFVLDGRPDNEALNLTVKLHIGSEYSTLAVVKKTGEELKNDAIVKALKLSGLM
jgi:hypothetical protein